MDKETTRLAEAEQAARLVPHPWLSKIEKHISGKDEISVADILLTCVDKEMDRWTQADQNAVVGCLNFLRWERFQRRVPAERRTKPNEREWLYRPRVNQLELEEIKEGVTT